MRGQIVILMVTALIEKNGKYLVLKRSEKNLTNKGKWQFPEGKVRFGEDLIKALKREVKEETGLIVTDAKLIGIHSNILNEAHGMFRLFRNVFKCKVIGKIKLSKEHETYAWVNKKELDKLDFIEGFNPNNIISVKNFSFK
ncbi:MAG: NUDIX domain-containing protein [Candidatus Aenigmatarchaeota archaeon]